MELLSNQTILETIHIGSRSTIVIAQSVNEDKLYFRLNCFDGFFLLEKTFQNNIDGRDLLEAERQKFNSEEKIKAYFGIKE